MRHVVLCIVLIYVPLDAYGQWVQRPGTGWVQASLYHHDTRDRFDEQGNKEPLFNEEGRSITTSFFLTGAYGVYRGIDVWAQLPVHRLAFNDVAADRENFGLGDPLLHVRVGPALFGISTALPVAIRGGVKLPLGDFPVDSEIVPLTEGQRDWELMVELGHSFYPAPVYVMGWAGYRWRETNNDIERKPGNERFVFLAVGGAQNKLSWKLALEAVFGEKWVSFTGVRIPLAMSERELVQVLPTVGWAVGKGAVELGGRLPVMGQNLPAGPALFLGYFVRLGS
ncbi:MAG: hypothetical protein AAF564_01040 [Bacteroidota bacterium]